MAGWAPRLPIAVWRLSAALGIGYLVLRRHCASLRIGDGWIGSIINPRALLAIMRTGSPLGDVRAPLPDEQVVHFLAPPVLEECAPHYTFRQFMDDSLYHPDWGYYSNGRIRFGHGRSEDFTTFPVALRPVFGAMIAERAAGFWHASGCPGGGVGEPPFLLLELGAGLGVLAHDILTHLKRARPHMYDAVIYVIGERSPALRAEQRRTNAGFVAEGRLEVRAVDAQGLHDGSLRTELQKLIAGRCHLSGGGGGIGATQSPAEPRLEPQRAPRICGVLLSNELPDAFAVEKIRLRRCAWQMCPNAAAGASPSGTHVTAGGGAGAGARAAVLGVERGLVLPLVREGHLSCILDSLSSACPTAAAAEFTAEDEKEDSEELTSGGRCAGRAVHRSACCTGVSPRPGGGGQSRGGTGRTAGGQLGARAGGSERRRSDETIKGLSACCAAGGDGGGNDSSGDEGPVPRMSLAPPVSPEVRLELELLRRRSDLARLHARRAAWRAGEASRRGAARALSSWLGGHGGWTLLSRRDYCDLKARCCAAVALSNPAPAAASAGPARSTAADPAAAVSGTLELQLDAAVRFAEVFEPLEEDSPTCRDGASALFAWVAAHTEVALASLDRAQAQGMRPGAQGTEGEVMLETVANPSVSSFGEGAARLFDSGAIITVDYGGEAATLLNSATVLRGGGHAFSIITPLTARPRPQHATMRSPFVSSPQVRCLPFCFLALRQRGIRRRPPHKHFAGLPEAPDYVPIRASSGNTMARLFAMAARQC